MKYIFIIIIFGSALANAEETCIFDTPSQQQFNQNYVKNHADSILIENGNAILISRNHEKITFKRGGCVHFGITIEAVINSTNEFNETELFRKVGQYTGEFGQELVNVDDYTSAIQSKNYSLISEGEHSYYFVGIPSVQAFEISMSDRNGNLKIQVSFYIN